MENISKHFTADDKKNSAVMGAVHRAGEEKWHALVEHGIGYKVGSFIAFNDSLCRSKPEATNQRRA